MSQTKKLTLSAIMVALGTAAMVLGAVFPTFDLTVCAFASLVVVFVYLEIGSYYPWLVWICTTICSALVYYGSPLWVEYFLIFGIYPLIKAYIERLPRWSWLIVKIVYINAVVWGVFGICQLLNLPLLEEEGKLFAIITYVLMNVAFVMYDIFIVIMVRFYQIKIRPRFKNLLK